MTASAYRWRSPNRPLTVDDYRRRAQRALPKMVWGYVDSGAEDLQTLHANRRSFGQYRLRSKVLTGEEPGDLSTMVAGERLSLPVLLAPIGVVGLSHWSGERGAALAAERHGTLSILSTASSYSIEEVAAATVRENFFQLYPRAGEPGSRQDMNSWLLERARRAGYRAMFVTVDVPVRGQRESEIKLGMGAPPVLSPATVLDVARRPRWTFNLIRHRRMSLRNFTSAGGPNAAMSSMETQFRMMRADANWHDMAWIRDNWDRPLYIKGVIDADDASRALDLGVDGIVVSNHGGRQLDGAPAALDALPAIVRRVGERAEVLVDGGIRRGSDVVKALCLGARAVCIGRPYLYGMAVSGRAGASQVIEILREEMVRTMTLMGVADISDLGPSCLVPADAVVA